MRIVPVVIYLNGGLHFETWRDLEHDLLADNSAISQPQLSVGLCRRFRRQRQQIQFQWELPLDQRKEIILANRQRHVERALRISKDRRGPRAAIA